jgi:L-glyceraldehyde 3-phosphate reductase
VGISSYTADQTRQAAAILRELGTPCLIHQPIYNMFERWIEDGLLDILEQEGIGCIVFSPLAQGLLTDRYLSGVPQGARATKTDRVWLTRDDVDASISKVRKLHEIARRRGQSLAQMAIAWILRKRQITSVLVGVSSVTQLEGNLAALDNLSLSGEELQAIEDILK